MYTIEERKALDRSIRAKSDEELLAILTTGPRVYNRAALRIARDEALLRGGDLATKATALFSIFAPSPAALACYPLLALCGCLICGLLGGVAAAGAGLAATKFHAPPAGYVRVGAPNPLGALLMLGLPFVAAFGAWLLMLNPLNDRLELAPPAVQQRPLTRVGIVGFLVGLVAGVILAAMTFTSGA